MALLSSMMRAAALTGNREPVDEWFAGRQIGWWARQWGVPAPGSRAGAAPRAAAARPAGASAAPPADPAKTLDGLTQLHERGILDDAEFERLRSRLRV